MTRACIVFEDPFVDRLRPMNLARPTSAITCGACRLSDLLQELDVPLFHHVRPHLHGVLARDGLAAAGPVQGPVLYVNAALVPELATLRRIRELIGHRQPFLCLNDQRVTVAWSPEPFPEHLAERSGSDLVSYLLERRLEPIADEFPTLQYTFDVQRHHDRLLPDHLAHLLERGRFERLTENVFVGEGTRIASNVVFDADDGPIVIGKGVRIRPFSYLAGPVRIGDRSLVIDHAALKHGTVLGHTVKAGGEIESAIIEPYSNKQHHGFLGHAYVGSWVNLGAGTSNSDLKNTYGEISLEVEGKSVATGLQFVGCVIGDFTKTAINTSIFTGKLIGISSFVYGFVSTNVPSFTNYARSFGQVTEVSVDVAIKTQGRAYQRRSVSHTPADGQLLRDLFELTRPERQLSSEQVVL